MKPALQNSDNIIVNCCTSFSTLWMSCEANTSSTSAESVVQLSASWVGWEEMRKEGKEGKEGKGRGRGKSEGERTREEWLQERKEWMGGGRRVCATCRITWSAFCDWSIFDLMESSSTSLFIDWAVSLSTCEKGYFIHTHSKVSSFKYGNGLSHILKYGNEFSPQVWEWVFSCQDTHALKVMKSWTGTRRRG